MAINWTQPTYSKMVTEVAYDTDAQEMYVTFASGKRAIYSGVPESVADQLARAPSVGSMMHTDIIPNYQFRYG